MKATNIMYVHDDEELYSAVESFHTFPRKEMSKIFHLSQKTLQNMSNDDLDDYVYRYLSNYKNFVKSDIYGFSAENCDLEDF